MPQGVGEKGSPMTRQIDGGHVAGQDPREGAGTAGAIVRPSTAPREVRAGAVMNLRSDRVGFVSRRVPERPRLASPIIRHVAHGMEPKT